MIPRYTRERIGSVWTDQCKMDAWLEVELAATDAWAEEGAVPAEAAASIRERAYEAAARIEFEGKQLRGDIAARAIERVEA